MIDLGGGTGRVRRGRRSAWVDVTPKPPLFSNNFCDLAIFRSGRLSLICAFIGLFLSMLLKKVPEGTIPYIWVDSLLMTNFIVMISSVVVMAGFTVYWMIAHK